MSKEKIFIFDSSTGVTGALKAGVYTADALATQFDVNFIIPAHSDGCKFINDRGYRVRKVSFRPLRKDIFSIMMYFPNLIKCAIQTFRILSQENTKILVINDHNNMTGAALKLLNWKGKIVSYVRRVPSSQGRLLSKFFLSLIHSSSDRIIAVSKVVQKELISSDKNTLIYDTVRFENGNPNTEHPSLNEIKFLYLGNYMEGKGQFEAVRAFQLLLKSHNNTKLKLMGGVLGLEKNKLFKNKLRTYVEENNLVDYVDIGDYCKNIEKEILNSHVLLNFAHSESFSMTCAEASLLERAVIATKCGGPEEVLSDGVTGILVNVGDISAMAEAMGKFLTNKKLINDMGRAGGERFNSMFSFSQYKAKTLKLFKEI